MEVFKARLGGALGNTNILNRALAIVLKEKRKMQAFSVQPKRNKLNPEGLIFSAQ